MNDSPKEDMTIEERSKIFKQELAILREKKLIPKTDYLRISNAYERHVHQANQMENQARLIREREEKEQTPLTDLLTNVTEKEVKQEIPLPINPELSKRKEISEDKKKVVAKVEKTSEQLRERNISIVLITGVIFLLFGGLIWATSTWGNLSASLKSCLYWPRFIIFRR